MTIYSVYIINKAGGLIYQYDHNQNRPELEKTFAYPLNLMLKIYDDKVVVAFGEVDGIKGKSWVSPSFCALALNKRSYYKRHLISSFMD